jgi:hypothetical protein
MTNVCVLDDKGIVLFCSDEAGGAALRPSVRRRSSRRGAFFL